MANTFNFVGKISIPKDTDKFKAFDISDVKGLYTKHTLTLNASCGDSRHSLRLQVFGDKNMSERNIYTLLNKNADGKYLFVKIPFDERFEKAKEVAPFKKFVIDTGDADERNIFYSMQNRYKNDGLTDEEKAKYDIHSEKDIEKLIENSYSQRKEFIYEYDFINELYDIFSKEEYQNMKFRISGNYQFTKSVDSDGNTKYYTEYIPTRIIRVKDSEEFSSIMAAEIIFSDSDCINIVETIDGEKNKVLNGYLVNYNKNYKKDDMTSEKYISMPISVNMNILSDEGLEKFKEKLDVITATSDYKVIGLVLNCIDGSPTLNFSEDMLTEDEKADIECGFYTFEDLKKEKGAVKGEKIKEFQFMKLATGYSGGAKNTEYKASLFDKKDESTDDDFNFNDLSDLGINLEGFEELS